MQRWDRHWFGPVAAIRIYLFQKCFLLVVACDLLVLMTERGGRYGLDSIPFNVPHFRWLDTLHAMYLSNSVPDASYYVLFLVVTSFLAFCLVVRRHRTWLMAIVFALYTYAWSMSRLDSYLHHYMLSLILLCMVFFPAIDGRIFRDFVQQESPHAKKKPVRLSFGTLSLALFGLACVYRIALSQPLALTTQQRWVVMVAFCLIAAGVVWRWTQSLSGVLVSDVKNLVGPVVSAWALRLLGTTVGVIYVFTSIAKMDAEWCGGHTLRQVGTTESVLQPIEQLAGMLGISQDWFWSGLATLVIPLELILAAMYLVAVRQDERHRVWLPRFCFVGWLLALGLHLNNEMMNLIIQWFGYYMLLLATLLLLPARYLLGLGAMFYWPESLVRDRYEKVMTTLSNSQVTVLLGVVSMLALAMLLGFGFFTWMTGGILASIVLAAGLVLVLAFGLVAGWERSSLPVSLSALVASALMMLVVAQCSMRFDFYDLRGKTLQQLGKNEAAIIEMEIAATLPPPSAMAAAELHTNLALSHRRMGDAKPAERNYRKAIELNPRQFLAHYGLANLLVTQSRNDLAETHYRKAIAIKSDFSDAYVNLGNVLEFKNRTAEAIQCYETALSIEKEAVDIQQMIEAAKKKLETSRTEPTSNP